MRRKSRSVRVGEVLIGGEAPVSIQSMTNTDTRDEMRTMQQIGGLHEAGCELVRVAVPDESAAEKLRLYKSASPLPLIADIQFDHRLALRALDEGADKIRINPGNIGGREKLALVARRAAQRNIPLRIGVNAGSLPAEIIAKHGGVTAEALVASALETVAFLESLHVYDLVLSLKASDVATGVEAYQRIADKVPYPLHLGVTEAGRGNRAAVKSAMGIGALLLRGIGDTVRVSLTGDPVKEIALAREILQAAGVRRFGPEIISCPTCARCKIDLEALLATVEEMVAGVRKPLKIAVMGCPVNGPGEAREADLGISMAGEQGGVIFKRGKVVKHVPAGELLAVFHKELNDVISPQFLSPVQK